MHHVTFFFFAWIQYLTGEDPPTSARCYLRRCVLPCRLLLILMSLLPEITLQTTGCGLLKTWHLIWRWKEWETAKCPKSGSESCGYCACLTQKFCSVSLTPLPRNITYNVQQLCRQFLLHRQIFVCWFLLDFSCISRTTQTSQLIQGYPWWG